MSYSFIEIDTFSYVTRLEFDSHKALALQVGTS
jgi:hypothetical protein